MDNIGLKLEQLFLKAGQTHYYQYTLTVLFTLEFCCTHFLNYCIPYLEKFPEIKIKDPNDKELNLYDLCNNSTKYVIKNKIQITSLVQEYGIYCNKRKIYFIGLCYYVGKIIGSCLSYLLIDGIGRKITLFICMPISILLMGAFKFMKASYSHNWIYGIYVDLFLSGIINYIIGICLLIFICENIQQTKIPYFVVIVVTGASISGLLCSLSFYKGNSLDWRNILLIFAGIHLVVYIFFLFLLIGSPMHALSEEKYENFSLYLRKIASRNGKILTQEDFQFLEPYIPKKVQKRMFENNSDLKANSLSSNSIDTNNNKGKKIINHETEENKNVDDSNNQDKDVTYVSVNNLIPTKNKFVTPKKRISRRRSSLKDIYLLSLGEDADVPAKSLFGESKMNDFTPFDLLRFQSQIKNFLVLNLIWIINVTIRTGIDLHKKYSIDYMGKLEYPIINFGLDMTMPFVLLVIYHFFKYTIQIILVTANLVQFIFFVFVGFFIQKQSNTTQLVILMLSKVCCHVVYLLISIITFEIYPIMIRTKGVGINIGFSGIGSVISIFLVENLKFDSLILYFLLFNLFSMIICYVLPNKIGTLLLDNPKNIKKNEENAEDEEIKLGDICIENAYPSQRKNSDNTVAN